MKNNKMFQILAAAALVTTALSAGTAEAATVAPKAPTKSPAAKTVPAKFAVSTAQILVNGQNTSVQMLQTGNVKLIALGDLAKAYGAAVTTSKGVITINTGKNGHSLQLQTGSKTFKLDGEAHSFTTAPIMQDNRAYVELKPVVAALGGEVLSAGQTMQVLTTERISGSFASVSFDANGQVIAVKDDADPAQLYRLNTDYSSHLLSSDNNVSNMTISPSGDMAAYTDENGQLYLLSLTGGQPYKLGADTSVKTDLAWTADGTKIYFLQGDKQEKISYISVDTGKITEVLADKVENKSEVYVSADQKKIVYIVNTTGVAQNDKDSTEDSLKIDYSGAGEQIYSLDLTVKDAKPVALTTTSDNKLNPAFLMSGSVVYLSADSENINAKNVIKAISPDGKVQDLIGDVDVTLSAANPNGNVVAAGEAADGSTKVYSIVAGVKTELYSTKSDITDLAISADGTRVAVVVDGKVIVIQNGKASELTK
ncbi:LpqB family beta-propeller domain-containing protein [Paenibacillus sp. KQZ6P-2]|uniref:LpqB family beta-propeller domain-containing protein n=1 Tax=Paenibacillus mangrovi TaxID=2931978 RepID=A0A9X1WSK1_9BACL|nr:LpqB family beta-propeller domain-containing protein [Paenibacillus mangrovi]MCJ8013836.1 LpqB family beta-propeller domain-containing protein [Paenibacillus mangrovi]